MSDVAVQGASGPARRIEAPDPADQRVDRDDPPDIESQRGEHLRLLRPARHHDTVTQAYLHRSEKSELHHRPPYAARSHPLPPTLCQRSGRHLHPVFSERKTGLEEGQP